MTRTGLCACVVGALLAIGTLPLAGETARFRHLLSVYADSNGAALNLPEGVACGPGGQVVVADTANDRLVRFAYVDGKVSGGTEIKVSDLSAPSHIQLNSKGEILALDSRRRRIVQFSPEGAYKGVLPLAGVPPPSTMVPKDFTIDAADRIYVLDVFSARVVVLDAAGQFQRAVPLPEDVAFGSQVAVDSAGHLLLLDGITRRLFAAAPDAAFARLGGDLDNVVATLPTEMMTNKGRIFVAEGNGSTIVALGRDGSFLARVLAMGWTEGSLNHPSQLCINDKDEVFIADRDNSRIQIFQLVR